MTQERPTPETDAFFRTFADGQAAPSHSEYYDRMAQLERERDEARDEVRRIQCWTTVNGVSDLERKLAEAREQRDRLAEALQAADECLALIEDVGHGAHMDNVTVARGIVQKALAAVKETSNAQAD